MDNELPKQPEGKLEYIPLKREAIERLPRNTLIRLLDEDGDKSEFWRVVNADSPQGGDQILIESPVLEPERLSMVLEEYYKRLTNLGNYGEFAATIAELDRKFFDGYREDVYQRESETSLRHWESMDYDRMLARKARESGSGIDHQEAVKLANDLVSWWMGQSNDSHKLTGTRLLEEDLAQKIKGDQDSFNKKVSIEHTKEFFEGFVSKAIEELGVNREEAGWTGAEPDPTLVQALNAIAPIEKEAKPTKLAADDNKLEKKTVAKKNLKEQVLELVTPILSGGKERAGLEELKRPQDDKFEKAAQEMSLEQLGAIRNKLEGIYSQYYQVPNEPTKKSPQAVWNVYRRQTRIVNEAFERDFRLAVVEAYEAVERKQDETGGKFDAEVIDPAKISHLSEMEQRLAVRDMLYQEQAREVAKAEGEFQKVMEDKRETLRKMRPPINSGALYDKWMAAHVFVNQFYYGEPPIEPDMSKATWYEKAGYKLDVATKKLIRAFPQPYFASLTHRGLAKELSRLPKENELYNMKRLVEEMIESNNVQEKLVDELVEDSLMLLFKEYTPEKSEWKLYAGFFDGLRQGSFSIESMMKTVNADGLLGTMSDDGTIFELNPDRIKFKRNLNRIQAIAQETARLEALDKQNRRAA